MSGGLEQGAIATIKYNRSLLKHNKLRYSDVKKQYIGIGNQDAKTTVPKLTKAEIAAGRERARIYLQKRKLRLTFQITLALITSIIIVFLLFWAISKLLTSSFFER
jgi:hypothetical protein